MTGLERLVGAYLDHLRVERGSSPHTIAGYRRDLARYLRYLSQHDITEPEQVGEGDVSGFQVALRQEGLATSSVARAVVAVRSLHKFAVEERISAGNPAARVSPPSTTSHLPKALGITDVQRLLDTVDREAPEGLRDAALLELLYGTGARISEICALDVDDVARLVDSEDETAGLRLVGKGNKERIVPLGSYARAAVQAWLVRGRPAMTRTSTPALLLNARGGRLARQSAWAIIRRWAGRAGLTAEISPHTLRHSFATHLLDGGADVRVVQELLGHASVTTTQIYTLVTVDHLREVYLTSHPRAY